MPGLCGVGYSQFKLPPPVLIPSRYVARSEAVFRSSTIQTADESNVSAVLDEEGGVFGVCVGWGGEGGGGHCESLVVGFRPRYQ